MKYFLSRTRGAWFVALLSILIASLGCSGGDDDEGAIKIALEGPLTGEQASNGLDMLRGVQLAVSEVNAKGGVLGRRVKLIEADDGADPERAELVARSVYDQGAVAVIGPYNSSVGLKNLPLYTSLQIVPIHLVSADETTGLGLTIQPRNSQISPVEVGYIAALKPATVVMLIDPSAYTQSMADRLEAGLAAQGIIVARILIQTSQSDYTAAVREALDLGPQVVYSSTYFPEGALIAKALAAEALLGRDAECFMGLANQDPAFVAAAGIADSQRCVFSGVPAPEQFPSAAGYVAAYREQFPGATPGVWGTFTYDSARMLFVAMEQVGTTDYEPVLATLLATVGYPGATGAITIDPGTGNRTNVPVRILRVTPAGGFAVVDS
jgi:ABC-type branched-subunit amino acid transport system substrate-binding protein